MNKLIEQIFTNFKVNNVSIPVSFLRYGGKSTTYITYMEWDKANSYSGASVRIAYLKLFNPIFAIFILPLSLLQNILFYDNNLYHLQTYLDYLGSVAK